MPPAKRNLLLVLCLIFAFQLVTIRPGMLGNEDACLYLAHARNIAFGVPYRATGFIYSAEAPDYSPAAYPFVFPLMIAPIARFSGASLFPFKVFLSLTLVLSLLAVALLYWRSATPRQLLLLILLLGLSPAVTARKNEITSDLPFLLFLYLAFLLFGDVRERAPDFSRYAWRAALAGFVGYLAYDIRFIGIGIIPCIILFSLVRHRKVTRFCIVATTVFAVCAAVQSRFFSIPSEYFRMIETREESPLQNLHFYAGTVARLWDPGLGQFPRMAFFAAGLCLFLIGMWSHFLGDRSLPAVTDFRSGFLGGRSFSSDIKATSTSGVSTPVSAPVSTTKAPPSNLFVRARFQPCRTGHETISALAAEGSTDVSCTLSRGRPLNLVTLFAVGYGAVLIWLPVQQARYLLPVVPVYFFFVVCGLGVVYRLIAARRKAAAQIVTAAIVATLFLAYIGDYFHTGLAPGLEVQVWDDADSRQLYDFVRDSTPQGAVFVASAPRAFALFTGRSAAHFPAHLAAAAAARAADEQRLTQFASQINATYLLWSIRDTPQLEILCQSITAAPPIFSNPEYRLYKIPAPGPTLQLYLSAPSSRTK
jgi:hypothetical protein